MPLVLLVLPALLRVLLARGAGPEKGAA